MFPPRNYVALRLSSLVIFIGCTLPAQNVLVNPGFEAGLSGWSTFGNVFHQTSAPPQFQSHSGTGLVSMFGNFWGTFNVTGVFQSFSAAPSDLFEMDAWSRHFSGDALTGGGAPNNNWVVMKIAFFDGSQTEIGGVETTILDGTFATNVWHDASPLQGTAPAGTASVQALVLFLQPGFGAGACHIDDLSFQQVQAVPTGVLAVGLRSRINSAGVFEVREVRASGSLGPWSEFEIRGIDVGWTPIGFYPWTTNPPMLADPAFHDVLDKLKDAGVNTLRFYYLPGSATATWGAQTRATLDLCYRMGFKVLWALDHQLIGTPQAMSALSTSVQGYGDHPATLGFVLGNEWNLVFGHAGSVAKAADVQAVATFLKSIDPNRAVISSLVCGPHNEIFELQTGGTTTATEIVNIASDVDLWGMNLYRAGTFHPFFHLWPQATSDAPYAIFEWGCDSWNQNANAVDYAAQAAETAWHMDEARRVVAGPSRQPAYAGTVVFAAVDEWWKNPLSNNSLSVQEPSGYYTTVTLSPPSAAGLALNFAADADGHRSEEHFGIVELPGLVEKSVFTTVADRFRDRALPRPDVDITVLSTGWLGSAGWFDNGYWGLRVNGNDAWAEQGGAIARGLNIVTFDTSTGSVSQQAGFDTYDANLGGNTSVANAVAFINGLPSGTLVGMAVADTMLHWNGNPAPYASLVAAIQTRTGSAHIGSVDFREGWALLGYVDANAPLAEGVPALSTQVTASANVVLDLDGDGLGDDVDPDVDGDGKVNVWETARGTDPVRPSGQLLALSLSMDASRILTITVLPGDGSGSYLDIDFSSIRFEVATPFHLDVTSLLYSDFGIVVSPAGGVTLTSIPTVPSIANGRLVIRLLDLSGRLYSTSIRID